MCPNKCENWNNINFKRNFTFFRLNCLRLHHYFENIMAMVAMVRMYFQKVNFSFYFAEFANERSFYIPLSSKFFHHGKFQMEFRRKYMSQEQCK